VARRWIGPVRESFPDFRTEVREVIAEGRQGRRLLRVLGQPPRPLAGIPPTGKRFEDVDEGRLSGFPRLDIEFRAGCDAAVSPAASESRLGMRAAGYPLCAPSFASRARSQISCVLAFLGTELGTDLSTPERIWAYASDAETPLA
jgi:hypothetical protein